MGSEEGKSEGVSNEYSHGNTGTQTIAKQQKQIHLTRSFNYSRRPLYTEAGNCRYY